VPQYFRQCGQTFERAGYLELLSKVVFTRWKPAGKARVRSGPSTSVDHVVVRPRDGVDDQRAGTNAVPVKISRSMVAFCVS